MQIAAPTVEWPFELSDAGPPEDPAIMLLGDAKISGAHFKITALRMREGLRAPDYRKDVPKFLYEAALDSMADDIEDLIGSLRPELIVIGDAKYLLWMVPAARD
jgi:hypothetical protein